MFIRNPYRGSFCGRMPITHSVARSFPQHCRLLLAALPYGILWMGINTKQKYFFVLGWMQIQGSKLECAWGRTHVHSHHMSSAADAKDAQNGAYFWVSIRSKNTFLCLAGCRYKEACSNVRGGVLTYVPIT